MTFVGKATLFNSQVMSNWMATYGPKSAPYLGSKVAQILWPTPVTLPSGGVILTAWLSTSGLEVNSIQLGKSTFSTLPGAEYCNYPAWNVPTYEHSVDVSA